MFSFGGFTEPRLPPATNPTGLWSLQLTLMSFAEQTFGCRNMNKKLYQPSFDVNGPHIRHTPNFDGGFAELSPGSQLSWSCAFYELAHETVHLLDLRPVVAGQYGAHYLEEAIAVAFSMHCCQIAGLPPSTPQGHYLIGLQHAAQTQRNLFELGKEVRERCGHFSAATPEDVLALAPNCPFESAVLLTNSFVGRST